MTPPPGDYILVATASGFLSYQGSLTITAGNQTVFPAESLLAGDVDGNNVIDQFDALTIGMSYTSSTPEAADLNNDAVIDFLDLELLAENYRQTGPTTGSPSMLDYLLKKPTAINSPIPGPMKTVIAPTAIGSPIPGPKPTGVAATTTQTTESSVPDVPLCPTHDPTQWHGLWDTARGCHYGHEHGQNPFTPEVAAAFPGFDLLSLLGHVQIGHTNPSSPMEVECRPANPAGLCDWIRGSPDRGQRGSRAMAHLGRSFPRTRGGCSFIGIPHSAVSGSGQYRLRLCLRRPIPGVWGGLCAISRIQPALPAELLTGLGLCIWSVLECAVCL
jgi:hypothetical protein